MKRIVKAPTGTEISCKNWLIEAAYRMIQNNLDPDVAFDPDNLLSDANVLLARNAQEVFDEIADFCRHDFLFDVYGSSVRGAKLRR